MPYVLNFLKTISTLPLRLVFRDRQFRNRSGTLPVPTDLRRLVRPPSHRGSVDLETETIESPSGILNTLTPFVDLPAIRI